MSDPTKTTYLRRGCAKVFILPVIIFSRRGALARAPRAGQKSTMPVAQQTILVVEDEAAIAETKGTGVHVCVCCVHPGAPWTPSWAKSGVKEQRIMPAEDIARAILDVYRLSRRTVVEEIVLRPQLGDL